jgi:hypothetical protein
MLNVEHTKVSRMTNHYRGFALALALLVVMPGKKAQAVRLSTSPTM